jgi:hypothetical protein
MSVHTYIMVEGQQMDASLQPSQSQLQGAFRATAKGNITIHLPTAKQIARDMIRAARSEKFAQVDARRGLAIDDDNATEKLAVKAAAKKLRDAPQDARIEAATTPDGLLAAVEAIIAEM